MSSNINKGLKVKDLVTTGIFSALFAAVTIVGGAIFASNPVLTFLLPPVVALITAPVYLVLVAKVPKHGPILILGILMACIMFTTGMYWMWPIAYIIFAIVAELISGIKNFRSMRLNILGYIIFSFNPLITYSMLWINQKEYIEYLLSKGTEKAYMDTMVATAQNWMLPAMIIGTLILAFIGAMIGKKLLQKQFEKAGII
ncbi:MptD family putative ECF transporter S component [Clostridium beijerinckii]|uniref:Energy-coupling factor transport system substrate-specific component n=1 Tax=Clostridium beijerinckii TaxID=1520 RepID=A0AAE5H0G7_CLOBE|nr:MptD family putative ECF transporter S component [Clostridium beijerinckii]NSB12313.1 energy-coupling factor transport system substrate-specific component [Clostridium beijerinckii]OOM30803.1 hypothetical protein CLOBE_14810 [Clostridium beijerinckii]